MAFSKKPAGILSQKDSSTSPFKQVGNIASNRKGDEMKIELKHGSDPDTSVRHDLVPPALHTEVLSDEN